MLNPRNFIMVENHLKKFTINSSVSSEFIKMYQCYSLSRFLIRSFCKSFCLLIIVGVIKEDCRFSFKLYNETGSLFYLLRECIYSCIVCRIPYNLSSQSSNIERSRWYNFSVNAFSVESFALLSRGLFFSSSPIHSFIFLSCLLFHLLIFLQGTIGQCWCLNVLRSFFLLYSFVLSFFSVIVCSLPSLHDTHICNATSPFHSFVTMFSLLSSMVLSRIYHVGFFFLKFQCLLFQFISFQFLPSQLSSI